MADETEAPAAEPLTPALSPQGGKREGPAPEAREGEGQFDALIDQWWADHFPGSVVAHYTECWNYAHSAKEALKALLRRT